MQQSIAVKDLLLVGGGHGHVHTIKMMGMKPMDGVRVTLISRDIETPYSGMLPGYVAGYYTREECHIDLGRLCSFSGVRLIHTEACHIDTENKLVHCKDGRPPIRYDVASIDIGIFPKPFSAMLKKDSITAVKPIDSFALRWDVILNRAVSSAAASDTIEDENKQLNVCVVGGGGGGVELCFALHHRLRQEMISRNKDPNLVKVSILNRGSKIMSQHNDNVVKIITRLMVEKGIEFHLNADIIDSEEYVDSKGDSVKNLIASDGRRFCYDEAVWCTQAAAQPWLKNIKNLEVTEEGFICVGSTLESTTCKDIFACGDVAHLVESPRPKAGVFAVRAGPPLTANLRARLLGEALEPWEPQSEFLGIIGTGDGYAVGSKGPLGIEGKYVWELKDKIDRDWMAGYSTALPDKEEMMKKMELQKSLEPNNSSASDIPDVAKAMGEDTIRMLSKAKMRCGGCGSKVGAQVLSRALSYVKDRLYHREEVLAGISTSSRDDAALVIPPSDGSYLVQTIDYFRSFIGDPYIFGKIAAIHSLSDVHAMNGEPVTAMALCVLPYGPEEHVENELRQMLAGSLDVLRAEKCCLVGGHTSEGSEPALGMAVNGIVHPDKVFLKGPDSRAIGHSIVLTKGLGTGTVLAADMRCKAKGSWVSAAIKSMTHSNGPATAVLYEHGCSSCTDVTGFGFMGHLIEMIEFSPDNAIAASINLESVPTLPGATDCIAAGVMSTLHPENVRCARAVANPQVGKDSLVYVIRIDMF